MLFAVQFSTLINEFSADKKLHFTSISTSHESVFLLMSDACNFLEIPEFLITLQNKYEVRFNLQASLDDSHYLNHDSSNSFQFESRMQNEKNFLSHLSKPDVELVEAFVELDVKFIVFDECFDVFVRLSEHDDDLAGKN